MLRSQEWLGVEEAHVADQDFIPADNGMQFSMPMITTVITSVDLSSAAKSQGLAILSFELLMISNLFTFTISRPCMID